MCSRPSTTPTVDVAGIVSPQVEVNSNWSRNALNFSAGATGAAYANYSSNDYLDAFASTSGRLDVTRDDIVSGVLRFDRLHEDRDDPDQNVLTTVGGSSGRGNLTRYYRGDIDGQYRHNFARFFTVLGGGVQRLDYEDVGDTRQQPARPLGVWRARAARLPGLATHRHVRPGQLQLSRL